MKINNEKYISVQAIPQNVRKACLAASWKSWMRPFVVRADGNFKVVTLNIFERLAACFLNLFRFDYFKSILGAKAITHVKRSDLVQADLKAGALFEQNVNPQVEPKREKAPRLELAPFVEQKAAPAPDIAPAEIQEHAKDAIVLPARTIQEFIYESYKGPTAVKYVERLKNLSQYFAKDRIYPTRGDGNCFTNAVAAGLICLIARNPAVFPKAIQTIQEASQSRQGYVTPDISATAPHYSKNFSKEKDFALVLDALQKHQGNILKLLVRQDFAASFSRVIRYLCLCQEGLTDIPARSGEDIDMHAIIYINACFDIQAKMAVLQAPDKEIDRDQNDRAYIKGGKKMTYENAIADLKNGTPQERQADFVIIRKSGHYIALV